MPVPESARPGQTSCSCRRICGENNGRFLGLPAGFPLTPFCQTGFPRSSWPHRPLLLLLDCRFILPHLPPAFPFLFPSHQDGTGNMRWNGKSCIAPSCLVHNRMYWCISMVGRVGKHLKSWARQRACRFDPAIDIENKRLTLLMNFR